MKKAIKPIMTAIIALIPFCMLSAAGTNSKNNPPDSLTVILATPNLNIAENEPAFVFSSMDWYRTVSVYDSDNGTVVMHMDVRRETRKQTSQLVFVPLSFFAEGDYVIELRKYRSVRAFRMIVHASVVILSETDVVE